MSFKELERVIRAFVSSRLDYCNSLYMGINRLRTVKNAARADLILSLPYYALCAGRRSVTESSLSCYRDSRGLVERASDL